MSNTEPVIPENETPWGKIVAWGLLAFGLGFLLAWFWQRSKTPTPVQPRREPVDVTPKDAAQSPVDAPHLELPAPVIVNNAPLSPAHEAQLINESEWKIFKTKVGIFTTLLTFAVTLISGLIWRRQDVFDFLATLLARH